LVVVVAWIVEDVLKWALVVFVLVFDVVAHKHVTLKLRLKHVVLGLLTGANFEPELAFTHQREVRLNHVLLAILSVDYAHHLLFGFWIKTR